MYWNVGALIESATFAALRYGSAAISITIVYQAGTARAGTSETAPFVVAAIGVLAAIFSMTAVPMARRAWQRGNRAIAALFIAGLLVSEPYLISYEVAWWEQNVSAAQARQKARQAASADHDEAISRAQETLRSLKGARDRGEVQADIDREMARLVSLGRGVRETLAKATTDCSDRNVPAYAQCAAVLTLRSELATVDKLERARFVVGTRVQDAEIPVPTNAGEARIARITGVEVDTVEDAFLIIGIAVLAFLRLTSSALGSDKSGEASAERSPTSATDDPRLGSERPMASLRLACDETSERGSGTGAEASPSMGSVSGDATVTRDRDDPLVTVTVESPGGDGLSKEATPAAQGACVAGVSSGTQGLPRRSVPAATEALASDSVADFYRERTYPSPGSRTSSSTLYAGYRAWCKARGIIPASVTRFGTSRPSYVHRYKSGGRIHYRDIAFGNAPAPNAHPSMVTISVHPDAHQGALRAASASGGASAGAMAGAV